ncbi:UDP-glucose 4-epimerase GalE [Derxia gummosa]|uniref:UDP-glucose 4-epimerase n=1 Tax=Derxia gummosa DSM 723 TaxID=1121388 RepID=A0A8B6X258_9BURK|nr:UDP-glucose 4-epimerase GalE [Derxia gummosa]
MAKKTILVTGGAGYIGSHTVVALEAAGYRAVILDNFCNSHPGVLPRLEAITGTSITLERGDVRDAAALDAVFAKYKVDAVIHFAALKAVGESVKKPLDYFENNIYGTTQLLKAMDRAGVKHFVFSSSATVYGDPESVPIDENSKLWTMSPYGQTKLYTEELLRDCMTADASWRVAILRYFNPAGAHESGSIGEDPSGIPNNLFPYITQVAVGRRDRLGVFGGDYPTPDGTCVRDYIHVVDLAEGHVKALDYLFREDKSVTVNLGTGVGYSVLDCINTFVEQTGMAVAYEIVARRAGDVPACYAKVDAARDLLGWEAKRNLADMCRDAWRWQEANPNGFAG